MPDRSDALVVICEPIHEHAEQWLRDRCRVAVVNDGDTASIPANAVGLIVRTYTRVNTELLDRLPDLRVVGRAGVGLDNIDQDACAARNVHVVNTPGANTSAVVEYVTGLLLDAIRPRERVTQPLDDAAWKSLRSRLVGRRELAGLTLGICGFGRIGSCMSHIGGAFGMDVRYHDLVEVPAPDFARPLSFNELLASADVLTVHVDHRSSNRGLFDAGAFRRCKADVVFINASRGFVVDRGALRDFLSDNPSATAILDVHDPEPIPPSDPLLGLENARLYPHIGAATEPAHERMSMVVQRVWDILDA